MCIKFKTPIYIYMYIYIYISIHLYREGWREGEGGREGE